MQAFSADVVWPKYYLKYRFFRQNKFSTSILHSYKGFQLCFNCAVTISLPFVLWSIALGCLAAFNSKMKREGEKFQQDYLIDGSVIKLKCSKSS